MSDAVDREVYALILRMGRLTLRGFVKQALTLVARQAAGPAPVYVFEAEGRRSAILDEIKSHSALKEYRRLIWLGWRLNYEMTPDGYTRTAVIVMRRGRRSRAIAFGEERPPPPD